MWVPWYMPRFLELVSHVTASLMEHFLAASWGDQVVDPHLPLPLPDFEFLLSVCPWPPLTVFPVLVKKKPSLGGGWAPLSCPKGSRMGIYLPLSISWRVWWRIPAQLLYLLKFNSNISTYDSACCRDGTAQTALWMAQGGEGWPDPPEPLGSARGTAGCAWGRGRWPQQHRDWMSYKCWAPSATLRCWTGSANGRNVLGSLTSRAVGYLIHYLMFPCWNQAHAH